MSLISQKCLPLKTYVFSSAVVTTASGLTSLQVLGVGFGDGVSGSTPGRPVQLKAKIVYKFFEGRKEKIAAYCNEKERGMEIQCTCKINDKIFSTEADIFVIMICKDKTWDRLCLAKRFYSVECKDDNRNAILTV